MLTRHLDPAAGYITRTFVREPESFASARAVGEQLRPGMQVSPYEGHMLSWLVRMSGARRVLEIGSFVGYSTLWMASALPEGGELVSLEISADHAAHANQHLMRSGLHPRAQVMECDALAFLESYHGRAFDLVFIDGVKKDYVRYLDGALAHLAPQGWIIADNAMLFGAFTGEVRDEVSPAARAAMAEYHARMADRSQFDSLMIPTLEGLLVARRVG